MQVLGDPKEVNTFMKGFKLLPEYHVVTESQLYDHQMTQQAIAFAMFDLANKEKNTMILQLTTANRKELLFHLDQAQVEKSDNGVTLIRGVVQEIYW